MEYLLLCYLLTVTKVTARKLTNGIVLTKSDHGRLGKLARKNVDLCFYNRKKILQEGQKRLSSLNARVIRDTAGKLEAPLAIEMLSEANSLIHSEGAYPAKERTCLFFAEKTLLLSLRRSQGLIALRSITVESERSYDLLMRSKAPNEEFSLVSDPEEVDPCAPVVIFEAVLEGSRPEVKTLVTEQGFTNITLANAARCNQYYYAEEPNFDAVKNERAKEIITQFRESDLGLFCQIDHIYTVLAKEVRR